MLTTALRAPPAPRKWFDFLKGVAGNDWLIFLVGEDKIAGEGVGRQLKSHRKGSTTFQCTDKAGEMIYLPFWVPVLEPASGYQLTRA